MNYFKITTQVLSTVSGYTPPTTGLGIYAHRTLSSNSYKLVVNGTKEFTTSNNNFPLRADGIPTGWTFARWECDSDRDSTFTGNPSSEWTPSNNPGQSSGRATTCTVKLYLTPTLFTVSFNSDGGSPTPSSQNGIYGETITLPNGPTKSGYSFMGWLIGSTVYGAGAQYAITGNVTAVAQWSQAVIYTVTFSKNASDATGPAIPNATVEQGGSVTMPTPSGWSRAGYNFAWWSTAADGSGLSLAAGASFIPTGDTTLYAQWSEILTTGAECNTIFEETTGQTHTIWRCCTLYEIQVSTNLGTSVEMTYQTRAQGRGEERSQLVDGNNRPIGNPTITSWSNSADQTVSLSVVAGTPGYAYVCNSGSSVKGWLIASVWSKNANNNTITTVTANNLTDPDWEWIAPVVSNFDFEGWYTPTSAAMSRVEQGGVLADSDFSVLVDANRLTRWNTIADNISSCLLAQSTSTRKYYMNYLRMVYRGVRVLVLLAANGGEISGDFWLYARYTEPYGTLPTPTCTGYTFAGWFTAATGGAQVTAATICAATTTHTLYARWSRSATVSHTVRFNAMGGTVSESSRSVLEGSALGTLPTPTRTGYTFVGWFTSSASGTQITAATVMGDDDIYACAVWSQGTITVTFNANGGTVTEATRTVSIGGQYQRLPMPTWNGHNFDGWFTAATGGTQITAATTVTSTVNQTLYAHWSNGTVSWWGMTFS